MKERSLPPEAPTMLESLRAIGYSFEAAIADLLDNSISAGAGEIAVQCRPYGEPYVAVIDDGRGMSDSELVQAMRHGSRDPLVSREPGDLGRFGLGLKTASLSQCRRLTVVSVVEGCLSAKMWDLDIVRERRDWVLVELSEDEALALPHVRDLVRTGRGTLVLWEKLDRATAGSALVDRALGELLDRTREHAALVFHRYLAGDRGQRRTNLSINANPVEPIDPYLASHAATQELPEESFEVEGQAVIVRPYILPHFSKLTAVDIERAGGEEGLRRYQGFYVYRGRRLITWGTWFRLARLQELTKLARVMVEVPNSLDHLWTLDIKKSSAYPPEQVRNGLRRIVERIAEGSRRVYTFRGRRTGNGAITHAWERTVTRDGIRYRINRDHPMIQAMHAVVAEDHLPFVERMIQVLETSFPFDAAYADMAEERRVERSAEAEDGEQFLYDLAARMLDAIGADNDARERMLSALPTIEPFHGQKEIAARVVERLRNAAG